MWFSVGFDLAVIVTTITADVAEWLLQGSFRWQILPIYLPVLVYAIKILFTVVEKCCSPDICCRSPSKNQCCTKILCLCLLASLITLVLGLDISTTIWLYWNYDFSNTDWKIIFFFCINTASMLCQLIAVVMVTVRVNDERTESREQRYRVVTNVPSVNSIPGTGNMPSTNIPKPVNNMMAPNNMQKKVNNAPPPNNDQAAVNNANQNKQP